ncbi:epoxide hydrolase [Endozoicomonas elysicola]|uniref:Epoxide hydrolase n=1 Tax=Endozoicomonas elysicola TaxID=305900 RepID=A0A081KFM8_9GAMM|nr:epoxide hydrolase [Endozoicomonas elysicola]
MNGISVWAAVEGTGPLVIMVHGWPELWYSWRHQIQAVAAAGYRVVAPDVRGYGGSDKPYPVEAYDMIHLTGDVVGLIDALGEETAILVGHDWGAPICWNTAALYPERVSAVAGLSVPYMQRGEVSAIELWKQLYQGKFFYQLYFQKEGIAEAELEADIPRALRTMYYAISGDCLAEHSWEQLMASKGPDDSLLGGMPDPNPLPEWLTDEDLRYFVDAYKLSGFRGSLNRYRAQQRDWALLPQLSELTVDQPSCFVAGSLDIVRGLIPGVDLYENPGVSCTDFRGATIIDGAGHWVQQERPDQVNRALLVFLSELS